MLLTGFLGFSSPFSSHATHSVHHLVGQFLLQLEKPLGTAGDHAAAGRYLAMLRSNAGFDYSFTQVSNCRLVAWEARVGDRGCSWPHGGKERSKISRKAHTARDAPIISVPREGVVQYRGKGIEDLNMTVSIDRFKLWRRKYRSSHPFTRSCVIF